MKILHLLYQSLPDNAGSSIRSRDILLSQKEIGLSPIAFTSPFQKPIAKIKEYEIIGDIKYYRSYQDNPKEQVSESRSSFLQKLRKAFRLFSYSRKGLQIAKKEKPSIIHAHATFFCGISGWYIARKLRVPFVYEVRSLWEERQLESSKSLKTVAQVNIIRLLEKTCYYLADKIIVINKNLKNNLIQKGVNKNKILIVANAVNLTGILNDHISFHISRNITFGYVGSLSPIEGLEMLIAAFAELEKIGYQNKLLIYGAGVSFNDLEKLIITSKSKNVFLKGRVSPENIIDAYNELDVIVNPRIRLNITESVTPLKPLEAMAYGKLVLASDVGGMKELISNNITGLLFKADDIDDLLKKIKMIVDNTNRDEINKIIVAGQKYILSDRTWRSNALKYKTLYKSMLKINELK